MFKCVKYRFGASLGACECGAFSRTMSYPPMLQVVALAPDKIEFESDLRILETGTLFSNSDPLSIENDPLELQIFDIL